MAKAIDDPLCNGAFKFTNVADVIYHLCPECGAPWIKAGEPHVRPVDKGMSE